MSSAFQPPAGSSRAEDVRYKRAGAMALIPGNLVGDAFCGRHFRQNPEGRYAGDRRIWAEANAMIYRPAAGEEITADVDFKD